MLTKADLISRLNGLKDRVRGWEAEGRDPTDAELAQLNRERNGIRQDMQKLKDQQLKSAIDQMVGGVGLNGGSVNSKSVGSGWSSTVADHVRKTADGYHVKALTTGSIDVPAPLSVGTTGIVELPDAPTRILDLLINRQNIPGNEFSYLRQTARTNNAAPVADGGTKPTSVFTVEEVEGRARVIAHLSEPVPERLFADYANLRLFLDSEMHAGVLNAVERQLVSGDGTGENMTGVLNTSGVVAVPFATDILTTCRKARTAMANLNEVPTAWVFNEADLESIDLMREGGTTGPFLVNTSTLQNVFGAIPRIGSAAVPAGTAILGNWDQVELFVREDARLDADRSGTLFTTNQVMLRVEGRYGIGILRPQAFAVVDLTAA